MLQHLFTILCFLISSPLCCHLIDQMTLEEKVGQLIVTYIDGKELTPESERLIQQAKIGGVIYYNWANELSDILQVQKLSCELQNAAQKQNQIPLFITIDQETGAVSRLQNGVTEFPGNAAVGKTDDPKLAYQCAYFLGKELKAIGINLNLAPVVDINNNEQNPIIGIRSFGSDKETVTQFAKESLAGFENANILSCLKHFPGHGDVVVDSHKALPVVQKSFTEIENLELYPFTQLVNQAPMIMTAHILFPKIDPKHCATLSSTILKKLLREKLKFKGVVITDSLTMNGISSPGKNLAEIAIEAFKAGNDLLLIGGKDLQNGIFHQSHVNEVLLVHKNLVQAFIKGDLKESDLNASLERILALKQKAGLFAPTSQEKIVTQNKQQHLDLSYEVAYRSVEIANGTVQTDLEDKNIAIIAPEIVQEAIKKTTLMQTGKTTTLSTFKDFEPTRGEFQTILHEVKNADYVIFCSYNCWKYLQQQNLLKEISKQKPLAWIATRDPDHLSEKIDTEIKILTYSPTSVSLQVAANWLNKNIAPLQVTFNQAQEIGKKIWFNESKNREDLLTFWNKKEPFPSIGIGHFIWPPKSYKGIFSDGRFHNVIAFLQKKGVQVPNWLSESQYCPWETRDEFYEQFQSQKMQDLRKFLLSTIPYQAEYMVKRLNQAFFTITLSTPKEKRKNVISLFFEIAKSPMGPYILVDYLNFKHEGTNPSERYQEMGWGLKQVLEEMTNKNEDQTEPIEKRFAKSAKKLLEKRVINSPNPLKEQLFLPGWVNRLKTYYDETNDDSQKVN